VGRTAVGIEYDTAAGELGIAIEMHHLPQRADVEADHLVHPLDVELEERCRRAYACIVDEERNVCIRAARPWVASDGWRRSGRAPRSEPQDRLSGKPFAANTSSKAWNLEAAQKRPAARQSPASIAPAVPNGSTHPEASASCGPVAMLSACSSRGTKTGQPACYLTRTTRVLTTLRIIELDRLSRRADDRLGA
jgi:hypothetical protein